MLIIDKNSVNAIKQKLSSTGRTQEVVDDVKKMLEIKQTLLWRSDAAAPCCGSLCRINSQLALEVNILEDTLSALESNKTTEAARLLEKYMHTLEETNEPNQQNYC